ncbi:MAG: hypothetical protein AAF225_02845 [Pseudomonadota bacterium]
MKKYIAAAIAFAFLPIHAMAAEVTIVGSGAFTTSGFSGQLSNGQGILIANPFDEPSEKLFSFEVVLDTDVADTDSGANAGLFPAVTSFKVTNALCSVDLGAGDVQIGSLSSDQVVISAAAGSGSVACDDVPVALSSVDLSFGFDLGEIATNELDPLDWPIDDANFTSLRLNFSETIVGPVLTATRNGTASGAVTDISVVPLPGALALFAPVVIAAGFARRGNQGRLKTSA